MNRKIRFLIISIIIIAGLALGINYVSNASVFDAAFGEELDDIKNTLNASTKFNRSFSSGLSAATIVNDLNTEFKKDNEAAKDGNTIEDEHLEKDKYLLANLFCIKHHRALGGYNPGQKTDINHSSTQTNLYELIKFDGGTSNWDKKPKFKDDATKVAWKSVYDAKTLGKCCQKMEGKTQDVYSNFNAILYKSNISLDDLSAPGEYSYTDKYRIPYILSFQGDPNISTTKILDPSVVQQALWGVVGDTRDGCNTCTKTSGISNCNTYQELGLHKAGIAVEHYLLEEQKNSHGETPKVKVPSGSQAGSAYLNDGKKALNETISKMEDDQKDSLETESIISDGIVRIGPFQMSDYAYAFSEHVKDYSNKDLEMPHVIAGIVEGSVTIGGKEIKIEAKAEGSGYVHGSDGTDIEGASTAAIVYKDWYDQVPLKYKQANSSNDVRGDATRGGTKETLNGKEVEILYKPIIDNSNGANAGVYSTGFTTSGSKELKLGEAVATSEKLEVMIKDADGNYTEDYPFPLPLSTFYIEVPISACGSAESILTNISFTYRKTTVSGTGDVISTRAVKTKLTFHESDVSDASKTYTMANPCTTYYCQDHTPSYATHSTSSSGGKLTCTYKWNCNNSGAPKDPSHDCPGHTKPGCGCERTWCDGDHPDPCDCPTINGTKNCTGHGTHYCSGRDCNKKCKGDHDCGTHCLCVGNPHSSTHESLFLCSHGHEACTRGHWEAKNTDMTIVYGQPMLVVKKAETKVIETEIDSPVEVRVREDIFTEMEIICVWHGWDSLENRGSSVKDRVNDDGFFDDIEELEWAENEIKASELGDRIVYRCSVSHTASVPLYIWLRIKYPVDMVADEVTTPEVYEVGPEEFYGERYSKYSGGWFSPIYSQTEGEETKKYINEREMTVDGKPRTKSIRAYVRTDAPFVFFFEHTLTKEIKSFVRDNDGKKIANTARLQIVSLDYKWKTNDNPDSADVNIDFNRACSSGGSYKGPVITRISRRSTKLIVKRYVVNLNKYIYDVEHRNDAITGVDTTIAADDTRGYKFANGTTNLYDLEGLEKKYKDTEKLKKNNPVYVEYGDRITYKIEVGNGKVTNRQTVEDFDYNVDKIYVTLVDNLPQKYSNLSVTIDNESLQGAHLVKSIPAKNSTSGGTIKFTDLMIPKNGVTTITVSFNIEEHTKGTKCENKAYVQDKVIYNYNRGPGKTPWTPRTSDVSSETEIIGSSSDWYVLNDYRVDVKKYISSYKSEVHDDNQTEKFTSETPKILSKTPNGTVGTALATNEDSKRKDWAEDKKFNEPVPVEKGDELIYSVKFENLSTNITHTGHKKANDYATQVRVSEFKDTMHPGLEYTGHEAYIYGSGGNSVRRNVTSHVSHSANGDVHNFKVASVKDTLIDPNEYIIFYIKVKVTESNMSLEKLYNHAELVSLTNINNTIPESNFKEDRYVKIDQYDENTGPNGGNPVEKSSEYIKMKDLVIAGKVWLDTNRDGKMDSGDLDSKILSDKDKERYLKNSNLNGTTGKAGVKVLLYQVDGDKVLLKRTTYTDANGMYTFSKTDGGGYYTSSFDATGKDSYNEGTTYQRVDKANGKDEYGNYTGDSKFLQYYIEYEYDGLLYKSTELYSRDSYDDLSNPDKGMNHLNKDITYEQIKANDLPYEIDSNAYEFDAARNEFNTKYEYISYNSAWDKPEGNSKDLEFIKDGNHVSLLVENVDRAMRSRSFINDGVNPDQGNNYLWLYGYEGVGKTSPETEYLKYINLGLEIREEVDISLTKDVYKVKTTINGESMEYDFNQNNTLNGASEGLGGTQNMNYTAINKADMIYLNDFIIKEPYGLELYEFDYKFRVDQYFSEEVRKYKGSESELNVEVTYRITVDNKSLSDSDEVKNIGKDVTETPLIVKIDEIMDVYEKNFMQFKPNDNEIKIKTKTVEGYLIDTKIAKVEAWYFVEDPNGNYIIENAAIIDRIKDESKETSHVIPKPMYKESLNGETGTRYRKEMLILSEDSKFKNNNISYDDYGYNKLYISKMEGFEIKEGESLDIYVKYVLDKGQTTINIDKATYEQTYNEDKKVKFNSATLGNAYGEYEYTITQIGNGSTAKLERSLKINDIYSRSKEAERGLENIAQVNAYSVWYENGNPAALVDRNSNVGNLGIDKDGNKISPDEFKQYDDTTYKTGIVISVEGTGMDKTTFEYKDNETVMKAIGNGSLERIIKGTVWDDARSETIAEGVANENNKQYVGNGIYSTSDNKDISAMSNANVPINYKSGVTEQNDFPIRNVKAEFIEIVKMPEPDNSSGLKEERYYEQKLQQVTWKQIQNTRTKTDGSYTLEGFIPGTYIVRFTYGDNVNNNGILGTTGTFNKNLEAQKDMLVFNGQDYKSTQFNEKLESIAGVNSDKIMEILEEKGVSDALDDEIRRLEVNSYSEVMTNRKAEILKGSGNGAIDSSGNYITTRRTGNEDNELEELINNTYMQAETVEFLIKPEKLTEAQLKIRKENGDNPDKLLYSLLAEIRKYEKNTRQFSVVSIDFGLEYRPESEIRLVKEIEEVKLITEDNEVLVDLFFNTIINAQGKTIHEIDNSKSKGLELVQFVTNDYNVLLRNLTNEYKQGFVFVQIDEEILQGCTVQIVYKFDAENNSEIDRIAISLDKIRYKENDATQKLITNADYTEARKVADTKYSASGVAAEVIRADMYRIDEGDNNAIYRVRQKTLVDPEVDTYNKTPEEQFEIQKENSYYGRYLAYSYYTGELPTKTAEGRPVSKGNVIPYDTVASLKFDKIIDYVDVNLEYKQESEQSNTGDKFWTRVKTDDLKELIYPVRKQVIDEPTEPVKEIQNGRGKEYQSMIISVDDRIKDDTYSTKYSSFKVNGVDDNIRNNDLSRFLLPKGTAQSDAEKDKYVATIRLPVSKVLSAESDKDDMSYENLAEIVQFTTQTGRRTNFATTIGNADIIEDIKKVPNNRKGDGTLEFMTASLELDTAATETITLVPPTGLMRNRRAIVNVVEATTVGVGFVFVVGIVTAIVIAIITLILFAIRKYKKRRII